MTRRYLIIGTGAAGMAAAERLRLTDPRAEITLVGEEPHPFYSRPGLAYLLLGHIPEGQLFPRPKDHFRKLRIRRLHARATWIDAAAHLVGLHDGTRLPYDVLLLATGARAARPQVPGMDLEGVVTLDTLADCRCILRLARRARRAVVVGGGITALELAEGLAARGVETHYLLRRDRYWGRVLDPVESRLVEGRLEHGGVRIHRRTQILEVYGRKGRVHAVETNHGRLIKCQMVAAAIGIRPRLELAITGGLAVDRGILVDEFMRTSAQEVFAAGDVAQVYDPQSGEHKLDSLWWVALEQGRAAADNMLGLARPYHKGVPFNVTRIGGLTTTIIGAVGQSEEDQDLVTITRGDSETWRDRPDAFAVEASAACSRLRLLVGRRHIVGALIMGDQTLSRPLQDLIGCKVDIAPIRERLLHESVDLCALILEYWERWKEPRVAAQP